jgi:hypothetical protein
VFQQGSEADFEEGLALSRCVALAWTETASAIGIDYPKPGRTIVKTIIQALAYAADLHSIENVEKLHSQFGVDVFSKIEVLG